MSVYAVNATEALASRNTFDAGDTLDGCPDPDPTSRSASNHLGTTVLVVDDSPIDRRLAAAIVEKHGEWRAVTATHGVEALAMMGRELPDVVLADLLMPEMDGLELVQAVRAKYPLVPVVMMTAYGSEDLTIQALQKGAASYVPKKSLSRDLAVTLEQVLTAARVDRHRHRLLACVTDQEMHFQLESDPALIPALVAHLQEGLAAMQLCDDTGRIRLGIALEEALVNALYHGNLECSSELRQDGLGAFELLVAQRRRQLPYRDRKLRVHARLSRDQATFVVGDEGPGFDASASPDPTDPANLRRLSGRGVLLIRTFMDEVRYNAAGNEVTMVKRRDLGGKLSCES